MTSIATAAPPSTVEQTVGALRALQGGGRHEEALRRAQALLADYPKNRDLLLAAAISLRHLLRIPEALAMLDRLEQLQPRFSQAHQERGLCHVARKDAPAAIEALLRAVNLNPALPMSWRMLEGVYRLTGDRENAATAAAHLATLRDLPPEVVTATSLFFDGEIAPAEQIIRRFLLTYGDHPEAMRLLGKIALARDVLDDAERLFESMLALTPDHHAARLEYAHTLVQRHKYTQAACEQARQLLAVDPANFEYRSLEASATVGLGDHEAAIGLYRSLLADMPGASDMHLWLGHALKTVGRVPEAIEAYRKAAELRPDFGDAYWSLANLKTYRFTDAEIAAMRAHEALETTALLDRYHLCFALGKAFEDRGEPGDSWAYYSRGNDLQRAESRYRPEILETNTRKQTEVCTRAFFEQRAGWGDPRPDPIFILGLPRSGSTLLEQILASHSQVEGTQELSDVQRVVIELQGRDPDLDNPRYPEVLETLAARGFPAVPRGSAKYPGRHARLPLGQTLLHRQDAEQFSRYRPDPLDAAPTPRSIDARRDLDVLLLQQLETALRPRTGVQLQHRGHRPLLPHLSGPDAPLGRSAARPGVARAA